MLDIAGNARRQLIKKTIIWGLWSANLTLIFYWWVWPNGLLEVVSGDLVTALHAIARLLGLAKVKSGKAEEGGFRA